MSGSAGKAVALVGYPGAGKTTVGRRLADRRGLPFVDSDEEVERRAGCSVRDIFARDGEGGFRARERDVVKGLATAGAQVIALGGGAFDDPGSRALLLGCCTVVWLDVPSRILVERLRGSEHRPLLDDGEDPAAMLRRLAYRRQFYAEAQLRVSAATSAELVARIDHLLDRREIVP